VQIDAVDSHQRAIAHPEAVRSHSGSLGKHAHLRPGGIAAWAPRSGHDLGLLDQMELKDDADMGEGIEPDHRIGPESIAVEPNDGAHRAPVVVDDSGTTSENDANWLKGNHDDPS